MIVKRTQFAAKAEYNAPALEMEARVNGEMLCDSAEGYTENMGEIDDFTW
jgi:hypothetical protein